MCERNFAAVKRERLIAETEIEGKWYNKNGIEKWQGECMYNISYKAAMLKRLKATCAFDSPLL